MYAIKLGPCRCELLLRFGLPCKHYLERIYHTGQPIPRRLVHLRYWLQGPAIRSTDWQPQASREEPVAYAEPMRAETESIGQEILDIRRHMGAEETARYDTQLQIEQLKMVEVGRQALALQAIPIGNPPALTFLWPLRFSGHYMALATIFLRPQRRVGAREKKGPEKGAEKR